jgi:hypothetical protein
MRGAHGVTANAAECAKTPSNEGDSAMAGLRAGKMLSLFSSKPSRSSQRAQADAPSARRDAIWLSALVLLAGCGAKTGLEIPEFPPLDASVDAPQTPDGGTMPDICIELPPREPPTEFTVSFITRISTADVLFLVDVTGSMGDEITQVRSGLRGTIVPGIAAAIPDVHFSVAQYGDFPIAPYGEPEDLPFLLRTASTSDLPSVQRGLDQLVAGGGSDTPESGVEALYLMATGERAGLLVPPRRCAAGTIGYPCFRREGTRIVIFVTDAPSHNGPAGADPYGPDVAPPPHTYPEALAALRGIGAKVLGLYSGFGEDAGRMELETIARDTGAISASGEPIVIDIGADGANLGPSVVSAVQTLVDEAPIDITIALEDDPSDDLDALTFVRGIETVAADPAIGAVQEADRFRAVRPGTRVTFRVRLNNMSIERGPLPIRYRMRVDLIGDAATLLSETQVEVVIPSLDGAGCAP